MVYFFAIYYHAVTIVYTKTKEICFGWVFPRGLSQILFQHQVWNEVSNESIWVVLGKQTNESATSIEKKEDAMDCFETRHSFIDGLIDKFSLFRLKWQI